MNTKVVNIYKDEYDVYIGRKGKNQDGYFGNPFPLKQGEERGSTLSKYKDYFYKRLENDLEFKEKILSLKGKKLGCFCKPNPCHGDIIKEYLDNMNSILDTKIDYFDLTFPYYQKGIKTVVPSGEVSLKQFIETIKNPKPKMKKAFLDIQKAAEKGDLELKDKLKSENLFFTTPSVKLKYRNYDSIESFLPFMVLEYDKIDYAEVLRDYIFDSFKSCIFAFLSPSKSGCKFIFLLEKSPKSVEEYKEYYFGIAYHLDKFKGLDISNERCVLPLFNSWDEDAKVRSDAVGSSWRGYKENAFDAEAEIDFEIPENIDSKLEKKVISKINYLIDKIEDNAHPTLVGISFLIGGWCSANFIGEESAFETMNEAIIRNEYMSKNTNGYLTTGKQMFLKGLNHPAEFKD